MIVAALSSLTVLAGVAMAQGRVDLEVSAAGAEVWGSSVNAVPGDSVDVRLRLTYTGTDQPLGLASIYAQPTISNWRNIGATDTMSPLVNGGHGSNTSTPIGAVADAANQFGRVLPYASRATNGVQTLTGFAQTFNGISYLRVAQANATDWVGTGFNATGGRGIPMTQVNNLGRTAAEPAFSSALSDIIIFKFRINLSNTVLARTMQVTIPADGFGNLNDATGVREIRWFGSMTEPVGSIVGAATVNAASIVVVPAPAGVALLGLGGLVVARRRR